MSMIISRGTDVVGGNYSCWAGEREREYHLTADGDTGFDRRFTITMVATRTKNDGREKQMAWDTLA